MKTYSDKFKEELNNYLNNIVNIISEMPAKDDEKYYINGYHGCGDYLLAVLEGQIVATIHGSYADTLVFNPHEDGDIKTWINFVKEFFTEKFGEDVRVIQASGDGGCFVVDNRADAQYIDWPTGVIC